MYLRYLCHITTLLTTAELLLRRDVRAHPRGVRVRARVPTGAALDSSLHRHLGTGFRIAIVHQIEWFSFSPKFGTYVLYLDLREEQGPGCCKKCYDSKRSLEPYIYGECYDFEKQHS